MAAKQSTTTNAGKPTRGVRQERRPETKRALLRSLAGPNAKAFPRRALGVGVLGMVERMNQLGGNLEIVSGAGGTTVVATVPRLRNAPPL